MNKDLEFQVLDEAAARLNKHTGGNIRIFQNSRGYAAMGTGGQIGGSAGQYKSFGKMHDCLIFANDAMYDADLTQRRKREAVERQQQRP